MAGFDDAYKKQLQDQLAAAGVTLPGMVPPAAQPDPMVSLPPPAPPVPVGPPPPPSVTTTPGMSDYELKLRQALAGAGDIRPAALDTERGGHRANPNAPSLDLPSMRADFREKVGITPPPRPDAAQAGGESAPAGVKPIFATPPATAPGQRAALAGLGGGRGGGGGFQWAISPEARKAAEDAEEAQKNAALSDRDIAKENFEATRGLAVRQGLEKEIEGKKSQWAEAHRQTKADAFAQGLADEHERYANMKVDPGHFWASQNTGQKILIGLAQAIANFGAGYTGHPERINAELNHLIDRDINAQKENIAHAGNSLAAKRGVYAEMLRKFGDERQAELATKQLMIDRMDTEAKVLAAQTGSSTAEARTEKVLADLKAQHADRLAKEMRPVAPAGTKLTEQMLKGNVPQENLVPLPGGGYVAAATSKDAEELKASQIGAQKIESLVREATALREDKTAFIPGTEAHARLAGVQNELTLAANEMAGLHRLSEQDASFMRDAFGNVTSWSPGTTEALHAASRRVKNGVQNALQGQGVMGAQTGFRVDPRTGQLVPYAEYTGSRYAPGQSVPMQSGQGFDLKPPGSGGQ